MMRRVDYLQLNRHGGALLGIVQATLVQRHSLFIGYSLSDKDSPALSSIEQTPIPWMTL